MPKTPSEVVPGSPAHTGHWQSWCNPAVTGILVSPPRLGRAGQSPIPSTVPCLIPRCGRRAWHGPRREREVLLGEANRGMPKGQSVSSDPPKQGCILGIGLLVGGQVALYSA